MIVYLKFDKGIKRIVDINLPDCSRPRCRHVIEDRIDPALWYKVLVLDSVLVDCDQRSAFWNREVSREAEYIHKLQQHELNVDMVWSFFKDREKIFNEGECYDFDPTVDELFDTAVRVFQQLNWESIDQEGTTAAYENLLKMLHVFILPRIKFSTKDRASVEVVLKWIEKHHEQVEEQIQRKDKTKRNTENSMHEQRKHLLEQGKFSKSRYVAACDPDFLNVFLPHLEKFIRKCNEELEEFEQKITPIRQSLTQEDIKRLKDLRFERDDLHETLQKAMVAREEIKNVIGRKHVKKKKKEKKPKPAGEGSFQLMYVEISKRLQAIKNEIQDLIKTKIKISSVREAVLLTLKEIDSDGFSYGYNCKKGSFQSEMDIFDPHHKPEEWITMREKVALHLQIKQAGFRSEHEKFCQRIRLQCQQLYDESKLFSFPVEMVHNVCTVSTGKENDQSAGQTTELSDETELKEPLTPRTGKFLSVVGTETRKRRSGRFSYDHSICKPPVVPNGYTSRWSVGSVCKEKCQSICEEITGHIQDMAYRLAEELYQGNTAPPKCYVNKIYVCYEEHVSCDVMPILNDLYEKSYQDHCRGLSAWLHKVPLSDVCGGDMKVLSIIHSSGNSSSSSIDSSRQGSSDMEEETEVKTPLFDGLATIGDRDMNRMSLEELYHIYEEQCKAMPLSFQSPIDMDCDLSGSEQSGNSDDNTDKDQEAKGTETLKKEPFNEATQAEGAVNTSGCVMVGQAEDSACPNNTQTEAPARVPAEATANNASKNKTGSDTAQANGLDQPPPYTEVVTCRKQSVCQPPPAYSTLPPMAEKFYEEFSEFHLFIQEEDEECTLFGKLRKMTGIIKYIESTVSRLRKEAGGSAPVSADDLVDVIIFLLCKLDSELLLKLYAHLNLMIHLSPRFMEGNAHEYSLVTLNVAYQHLFEQSVMRSMSEQ